MKKSFLVLLVVVMAENCFAQQETEMKKMLNDIGVFAGEWKVSVEARLSSQGPWDSSTGKSVIKKTLNSKILEEDFTGSRQAKPFAIKCLIAINNQTKILK